MTFLTRKTWAERHIFVLLSLLYLVVIAIPAAPSPSSEIQEHIGSEEGQCFFGRYGKAMALSL